MKTKYLTILSIYILFLIGCATKFVVLRDVPENPSFVVIPVTYYLYQIEFANVIESAIIKAGVKVIERPSIKEIITKKGIGEAVSAEAEKAISVKERAAAKNEAKAETILTEKYIAYEEINADYIVMTYADYNRVRIIKKDTREVLASFEASEWDALENLILEALKAIGISTRKFK